MTSMDPGRFIQVAFGMIFLWYLAELCVSIVKCIGRNLGTKKRNNNFQWKHKETETINSWSNWVDEFGLGEIQESIIDGELFPVYWNDKTKKWEGRQS